MSGIKSTSGGTPPHPVDTAKGAATTQQQVAPVSPASPTGGHSGPAIPQASSVSQLSEGALISAIVTARATGGDTMLHAEIGNFRMSTGNALNVGSHIVLEVETFEDIIVARIISINGEKMASPPAVTLLPMISGKTPPIEGYGVGTTPSSNEIKTGLQNLTAALGTTTEKSLHSSAQPQKQDIAQAPNTSFSSLFATKSPTGNQYGNTSVPIPSVGPQGSTPVTSQTQLSGAAAYAHTNSPGPKNSPTLPNMTGNAGATVNKNSTMPPLPSSDQPTLVRATIQRPPLSQSITLNTGSIDLKAGSQITLIASRSSGSSIASTFGTSSLGTVIGSSGPSNTATGIPVTTLHVQTASLGTISYVTPTPLQIGAQVNLVTFEELQQFPLGALPISSTAFKTPQIPILSEWENLRNGMNILMAQDPAQALSLLNRRIPSPNSQLGGSLLFFLSALNGGSLDKWLGQDFRRALENAGHQSLLSNMDDDFATLARISSEPGGNDWKNLTFPFYDGASLRQIKMFYRQRHNGQDNPEEDSTRFVIELDLSKSGPMQLDGLFNKLRFDLVLRSQFELPEELRQHISQIFDTNLEITGIQGNLVFQRTTPFPVHPTEEWVNEHHDTLNA